jgi:hypothetical protein
MKLQQLRDWGLFQTEWIARSIRVGLVGSAGLSLGMGNELYEFGNPGPEEQYYIELINRARSDPKAEGARLAATTDPMILSAYQQFGVNLTMMQAEFNALAAAGPLAPNAALTAAARLHSQWMLATGTQDHNQSNPFNTPGQRISAAGYPWNTYGENLYAYSHSTWFGHAGFQVDWGSGGTGGMQDGRGHRMNIHESAFREIGVGVVAGSNGGIGPQLVTQDFGARALMPALGTGVVYYDLNQNHFYDAGEGVAGLTVNLSGASHYCTTAAGGGWVVPVTAGSAQRTVTFSGLGVNASATLEFPPDGNAKADLKMTYQAPVVRSPAGAVAGSSHEFTFDPVAGATGYVWKRTFTTGAAPEPCESISGVTTSTSGVYQVRNTSVKHEGESSFHLQNSTGQSQWIELNGHYRAVAAASLTYQSRIRSAAMLERFHVEAKADGTDVWQQLSTRSYMSFTPEPAFSPQVVSLASLEGKSFRIRFRLEHVFSYSPYTGDAYGWFIDDIRFSGVSLFQGTETVELAGNSGTFIPQQGTYLMTVAPRISGREFPATTQTLVVAEPPVASPSFATWAAGRETELELPAGSLADPLGDFDADGRANLVEYAFGTSPASAGDPAASLPKALTTPSHLILEYRRDRSLGDIDVAAEAATGLGAWKTAGETGAPAGFVDEWVSNQGEVETRRAMLPLTAGSHFLRIRVSRNAP